MTWRCKADLDLLHIDMVPARDPMMRKAGILHVFARRVPAAATAPFNQRARAAWIYHCQ